MNLYKFWYAPFFRLQCYINEDPSIAENKT